MRRQDAEENNVVDVLIERFVRLQRILDPLSTYKNHDHRLRDPQAYRVDRCGGCPLEGSRPWRGNFIAQRSTPILSAHRFM